MFGGCARVNPRGIWPPVESRRPSDGLSLRRAYGHSCNGFFAKLAVNSIGLGPLINMAHKLGWNSSTLASDFFLPPSPLREPSATIFEHSHDRQVRSRFWFGWYFGVFMQLGST